MNNFLSFYLAHAAEIELGLPSVPGTESSAGPVELMANLIRFAFYISGVLAFGAIVFGGIKYMSNPGNGGAQSEAKDWIISALQGLALLFASYLILNLINPDLTELKMPGNLERQSAVSSTVPNPRPLDPGAGTGRYGFEGIAIPAHTYSDAEARAILSAAGISVNKPNCQAPPEENTCTLDPLPSSCTNCTSLSAIKEETITKLVEFKAKCESKDIRPNYPVKTCDVVVTGGTEAGHKTHGIALPILDLGYRPTVNEFIYFLIGNKNPTPCRFYSGIDGNRYMFENSSCGTPTHWHVEF